MPKERLNPQEPVPNPEELAEIDSELAILDGKPANYIFDFPSNGNIDTHDILGLHFNELPKIIKFNTRAKDAELAKKIASGDQEAKNALLYSVVILNLFEAKKRTMVRSLYPDSVQEGYLVIWEKAIPKYDPEKGKFSTYATWWIRQAQGNFMAKTGRIDMVSRDLGYEIKNLQKKYYSFMAKNGREPSNIELAGKLEMPPAKIERLKEIASQQTLLFSNKIDEDDNELGEMVADGNALQGESLEDYTTGVIIRDQITKEVMAIEKPRYREILKKRLGINEQGKWNITGPTLEEIAADYKVTRERIRQLQREAIAEIGDPLIRDMILKYLNIKKEPRKSRT